MCTEVQPVLGPVKRPPTLVLCDEAGPVRRVDRIESAEAQGPNQVRLERLGGIASGGRCDP